MANEKQIQKAGDNSTQIQADAVYLVGIDEKRAREVYTEMSKLTIEQCTSEAEATANARIGRFEEALIPRIERIENDFRSFSDPSFQVQLKKAQLTAACTGRESDYAILAELLVHRIKNKNDIKKKAYIQKAVEIIDQIDDDSLIALSVFHAINSFTPNSGFIKDGMQALSELYERLGCYNLPNDSNWIDNLSVLGAISIIPFSSLQKYEERFKTVLDGYVTVGIKKGGDRYINACDILISNNVKTSVLVDNELLSGYVRFPVPQKGKYDHLNMHYQDVVDGRIIQRPVQLTNVQKDCFNRVFEQYEDNSGDLYNQVIQNWHELLHSYQPLHRSIEWWNSLRGNIQLTAVGKTIAHTYAKQIDPSLPDLD